MKHQWDRTLAVVLVAAAALALLLGWLGVADARLPAEQIPYLASGGLIGIFLLGIGATLWLSADMRDEWRKLDEMHRDARAHWEREQPRADAVDDTVANTTNGKAPRRPLRVKG